MEQAHKTQQPRTIPVDEHLIREGQRAMEKGQKKAFKEGRKAGFKEGREEVLSDALEELRVLVIRTYESRHGDLPEAYRAHVLACSDRQHLQDAIVLVASAGPDALELHFSGSTA